MTETIHFTGMQIDPAIKQKLETIATRFSFPHPVEHGRLTLRITEIEKIGGRYRVQAEWGHRRSSVSYFRSGKDIVQTALSALRHLSASLSDTSDSIDLDCAA